MKDRIETELSVGDEHVIDSPDNKRKPSKPNASQNKNINARSKVVNIKDTNGYFNDNSSVISDANNFDSNRLLDDSK